MRNFFYSDKHPEERRRHPRFKVRYFLISSDSDKPIYGSVIDISRSGMGVISSHDIPLKELDCDIKFSIGNYKGTDLRLMAEPVWKHGIIVESLYRSGIEINKIVDPFNQVFEGCMQQLEVENIEEDSN